MHRASLFSSSSPSVHIHILSVHVTNFTYSFSYEKIDFKVQLLLLIIIILVVIKFIYWTGDLNNSFLSYFQSSFSSLHFSNARTFHRLRGSSGQQAAVALQDCITAACDADPISSWSQRWCLRERWEIPVVVGHRDKSQTDRDGLMTSRRRWQRRNILFFHRALLEGMCGGVAWGLSVSVASQWRRVCVCVCVCVGGGSMHCQCWSYRS